MDLLASLNLTDLPEQQTHISSHVQDILDNTNEGSADLRLGFNVCCCCATNKTSKSCPGCNRVRYCSQKCLDLDTNRSKRRSKGDESDPAFGHAAVICSLLQLCQVDEDVAEDQQEHGKRGGGGNLVSNYTKDQIEAAQDRIRSEYESYPATIANILIDNPYFETCFNKRARTEDDCGVTADIESMKQQRRGKRDREKIKNHLVIHVVGASEESELWGDFHGKATVDTVHEAYAEAFVDLSNSLHLKEIHLIFIGPNCPMSTKPVEKVITSDPSNTEGSKSKRNKTDSKMREQPICKLIIESYPCDYNAALWTHGFKPSQSRNQPRSKDSESDTDPCKIPKADVIFFFNPGFTCPDYSWDYTVHSLPKGIPFVVATNTEMEALADIQYLHDMGIVSENADSILETLRNEELQSSTHGDSLKGIIYLGENPFSGLRVRQNGTMANDLYVKNRWLFIVAGTQEPIKPLVQNSKKPASDPLEDKELTRKYFI